jgi:hypothetical protein
MSSKIKELRYSDDALCLKSCQVTWLEGGQLVDLYVTSDKGLGANDQDYLQVWQGRMTDL